MRVLIVDLSQLKILIYKYLHRIFLFLSKFISYSSVNGESDFFKNEYISPDLRVI